MDSPYGAYGEPIIESSNSPPISPFIATAHRPPRVHNSKHLSIKCTNLLALRDMNLADLAVVTNSKEFVVEVDDAQDGATETSTEEMDHVKKMIVPTVSQCDENAVRTVIADDDCAEESPVKAKRAPTRAVAMTQQPPRGATPTSSSIIADKVSNYVMEQIAMGVAREVSLEERAFGDTQQPILCCTGAEVVDALLKTMSMTDRKAATGLANKLYTNGAIRALQPGGFADQTDTWYRFKANCHGGADSKEESEVSADAVSVLTTMTTTTTTTILMPVPLATPLTQGQMFSISNILGKTEEWLNASLGQIEDSDDASSDYEE